MRAADLTFLDAGSNEKSNDSRIRSWVRFQANAVAHYHLLLSLTRICTCIERYLVPNESYTGGGIPTYISLYVPVSREF